MSKLLVVEDDKFLVSAYRAKLTKAGYEIATATDGEEALNILEHFSPDLILLDLVMPKKDGFATLEDIRKNPKLKNVPVIVASNLGQKEDIDRATKLGATDYIIKTDLSLDELLAKIAHFVKRPVKKG